MANALSEARLPLLLFLSGNDFVADEFDQVTKMHPVWCELLLDASVKRLKAADHTFSSAEWRDAVAADTEAWLTSVFERTREQSAGQQMSF
jgi:hypothetical protein